MADNSYTVEQVKELADAQAKVPGEAEVVAAGFKVEREYRDDGNYSWRAPFKTCDEFGKITADGAKYLELTAAGRHAHEARMSKIMAAKQREALRGPDGSTHYVDAGMAEVAAAKNGWRPKLMIGGAMMKRFAVRNGKVVQVSGPRDE